MRPAALASLGLIGFLACAGTVQAQPAPTPSAPTASPPAPAPATTPAAPAARPDGKPASVRPDGRHPEGRAAPADGGASTARPATPERAATPRRRRPSYAACNRASQRRSLKGGARRRFLIRCRLGYERIQPGQPARAKP
ncbi:hypothetical protein DA075_26490 [Methylobacterium currus]|uniref:Serine/threonine protein kinase n=1 Tax=Methylobacterium currus TaxID=2051553 RepID=A0A2R4WR38_9HYPH|nr:hypothetical protein [Methylobacterium currus]AWB23994.1 hypothetical protein DA075_26490 [Methylobacterium currus]UHC15815.1 hypothetical protein LRS73_25555 [Methylobacterium currus]